MLYPLELTAVVCSFISLILSVIYLFGKRFWIWVFPFFLSLVLFASSGLWLYGHIFGLIVQVPSDIQDLISTSLAAVSGIWIICIVFFRIAAVPSDRQERKRKRARSEANYVAVGKTEKD